MHVEIPDELADKLRERAAASGTPLVDVAVSAIRRALETDEQLERTLSPIREAFQDSGMSEDQAVELFEAEKHAMRQGR